MWITRMTGYYNLGTTGYYNYMQRDAIWLVCRTLYAKTYTNVVYILHPKAGLLRIVNT